MHVYDFVMIAVVLAATAFGAYKGMAWQLASLASLTVSYVAALHASTPLAPYFGREAPWNRFMAMLVTYLVVSAVIWLIYRRVAKAIERIKLVEWDRQVGGLFGALKGVLFCLAITFFAVTLSAEARQKILQTHSGRLAAQIMSGAHGVIPEELHKIFHSYMHQFDGAMPHRTDPTQWEEEPDSDEQPPDLEER